MIFSENVVLGVPATTAVDALSVLPMKSPQVNRVKVGRRKLWQINPHYHCLVLGTCFDVDEIRNAAARCGFEHDALADYEIHHASVSTAGDRRHPFTIELQKRLEAKFSRETRLFNKTRTESARERLWEERRESGDIAGALWALVSHSAQDSDLLKSVYGQVHMLQHGTCARESKLRRRVATYRDKIDALVSEHEDDREHLVAHLNAASERSDALKKELAECRAELSEARKAAKRVCRNLNHASEGEAAIDPARLDTARAKLDRQSTLIAKLRSQAERYRAERARATEDYEGLDLAHQQAILTEARDLGREAQVGVQAILHDPNLATLHADRIAIMDQGRLRAVGMPSEVLSEHLFQQVFHLPVTVIAHPNHHDRPLIITRRVKESRRSFGVKQTNHSSRNAG